MVILRKAFIAACVPQGGGRLPTKLSDDGRGPQVLSLRADECGHIVSFVYRSYFSQSRRSRFCLEIWALLAEDRGYRMACMTGRGALAVITHMNGASRCFAARRKLSSKVQKSNKRVAARRRYL